MRDLVTLGCGGLLAIVLLLGVLIWAISLPGTASDMARIEQLRRDAAQVDPQQAEDVIGQVTDWNQKIAMWSMFDRTPIIGILIPDDWSRVELIPVPTEE